MLTDSIMAEETLVGAGNVHERLAGFEVAAGNDRQLLQDILARLSDLHTTFSGKENVTSTASLQGDEPVRSDRASISTAGESSESTAASTTASTSTVADASARNNTTTITTPVAASKRRHSVTFAPAPSVNCFSPATAVVESAQPNAIITPATFSSAVTALRSAIGPMQRKNILQSQVAGYLLTSSQFAILLSFLRYVEERSWAAECLSLCVVDIENCSDALLMYTTVRSEKELRAIQACLARARHTAATDNAS
ncbi:uncharacterized protein LOC135815947 [Sycon ciliatum]|uniref:uncharacterized protein LOC135815947 n=1 Tax=Sycon ciliatum TaxID=27933 RepID=UPI0031F66667|eukprot:scpid61659/ scgid29704/ 